MKLSSLLTLLLLTATLHAATPEEIQFQQLKQQRAKTPAGTSEMLDQRYRTSLEQMLRLPSVALQPELARQIQAELQATADAKTAAAATATPRPRGAPVGRTVTKSELKKLFENSRWHEMQPSSKEPVFFTFTKDGQFERSAKGDSWHSYKKWEVKAPDVLTVFTHHAKGNKTSFRAFRVDFEAKTAAPTPISAAIPRPT